MFSIFTTSYIGVHHVQPCNIINTPDYSRKSLVLSPEDQALIGRFLEATAHLSPERAAQGINGLSGPTVRRYRDGKLPSRLTTDVRLALLRFVNRGSGEEERPEDVLYRPEEGAEGGGGADADHLALVLGQMEQVARFMTRMGPPGIGLLAKRAYLNGIRDIIAAAGMPLPTYWYELSEKVESGAL